MKKRYLFFLQGGLFFPYIFCAMPTAFVTDASRGIGLEFVRQLAVSWKVIASRRPSTSTELLVLEASNSNIERQYLYFCTSRPPAAQGASMTTPVNVGNGDEFDAL